VRARRASHHAGTPITMTKARPSQATGMQRSP
jgi:hypothetical protein